MLPRQSGMRDTMQNVVAWLGLFLMLASVIWWEWIPRASRTGVSRPPGGQEPFSLVVLDPGHGGQDSGAVCGGILEKDLTLDVARRIDRLLNSEGIATLMTRVGDTYVSLADRAAFSNRIRKGIFV